MGVAARIRALRIRAGRSQAELAQAVGLNVAWYADLEIRDNELAATLTLFKAMELASVFAVPLHELLGEPTVAGDPIGLIDLPQRIVDHAKNAGISIEQLEERTGWELREFLDSPILTAAHMPIAFFQAVASALGINWLSLVPDERAD
jgi:transcriptional regulator with XRE-family HTH domain